MKARIPVRKIPERREVASAIPRLTRIYRECEAKASLDSDTDLLWIIRKHTGWGRTRLLRFYRTMLTEAVELHRTYGRGMYDSLRWRIGNDHGNLDEMMAKASAAALHAKADNPWPPVAADEEYLLDESVKRFILENASRFELTTIWVLRYDMGTSWPKIQRILDDLMIAHALYDRRRLAEEYAARRMALLDIGVDVKALQAESEAAANTIRKMEEEYAV